MRSLVVWCSAVVPLRVWKKKDSGVSKVCCPRCIRTMDRAHLRSRLTLLKEAAGLGRDYTVTCLVRNL